MKTQMSKTQEGQRTLTSFKQRIGVCQFLQGKGDEPMATKD